MWWLIFVPFVLFAHYADFEKAALKQYEQMLQTVYQKRLVQGELLRQPLNPSIFAGVASYDGRPGARIGMEIPLRLGAFERALQRRSENEKRLASALLSYEKRIFLQRLRLLFTELVKQKKLMEVTEELLKLQNDVVTAIEEKVAQGFAKRIEFEAQQSEALALQTLFLERKRKVIEAKSKLLAHGAVSKDIDADAFLYTQYVPTGVVDPLHMVLEAKLAVAKAKVDAVVPLERVTLVMEYEKEPDQHVAGVALSVALPIFRKREQKGIARFEVQRIILELQRREAAFKSFISGLQKKIALTSQALDSARLQVRKQEAVFKNYLFGFKNGGVDLLQLLDAKRAYFQSKQKVVELEASFNEAVIEYETYKELP